MQNTIVHDEGAASLKDAVHRIKLSGSMIKIGLDVHARLYVAVAQYDYLLPKPARRFAPIKFCRGSNDSCARATPCMWFTKRAALALVSIES